MVVRASIGRRGVYLQNYLIKRCNLQKRMETYLVMARNIAYKWATVETPQWAWRGTLGTVGFYLTAKMRLLLDSDVRFFSEDLPIRQS